MGSSQNTSKKFQLRLGMEKGGKRENKEDGMRDWRDNEGTRKGEAPEHVQRPNNPNMSKGRVTPLLRAELHRTKQHLFHSSRLLGIRETCSNSISINVRSV